LMVTQSVSIAGVLVVFSYLIIPAARDLVCGQFFSQPAHGMGDCPGGQFFGSGVLRLEGPAHRTVAGRNLWRGACAVYRNPLFHRPYF